MTLARFARFGWNTPASIHHHIHTSSTEIQNICYRFILLKIILNNLCFWLPPGHALWFISWIRGFDYLSSGKNSLGRARFNQEVTTSVSSIPFFGTRTKNPQAVSDSTPKLLRSSTKTSGMLKVYCTMAYRSFSISF